MTSDDLERRLQAWYQAEVGTREVAPASLYASLAEVADASRAPGRRFGTVRSVALLVAAAITLSLLVGGAIAIGSGLLSLPWAVDEVPRAQPMVWSESSLDGDWPAAIRDEGPGTAAVLPLVDASLVDGSLGHHTDALGDVGPAEIPWLDIEEVRLSGGHTSVFGVIWAVDVQLAANIPLPIPDPRDQWIAYGLVLDTNGDGVPDVRLGMDNMPVTDAGHRAWRTDLHEGQTDANPGAPYGLVGGRRYVDTYFPGESTADLAEFNVGLKANEPTFRFYAWASLIEDGRVVATDYAPDVGWLEPASEADR